MLFKTLLLTTLACFTLSAWAADLPAKFDPARETAKDVALAVNLAKAQGKHVNKQGALEAAHSTGVLESGKGYDKSKVLSFLNHFAQN